MRKYKRWVSIGEISLEKLVNFARENGMQIITAYKPSMNFYNQIGVYGTPDQVRKTDEAWENAGHKVLNRKPRAASNFSVNIPKEEWVDRGSRIKTCSGSGTCQI